MFLVHITICFYCTERCSNFRNAVGELMNRGAKTDVMCDYPKSELRAFIGQLPKRRGQHYVFEKQYVQSHKGVNPISRCMIIVDLIVEAAFCERQRVESIFHSIFSRAISQSGATYPLTMLCDSTFGWLHAFTFAYAHLKFFFKFRWISKIPNQCV